MKNDPQFVRRAFAEIAPRYDRLNTILSFGVERRWRKKVVDRLGLKNGDRVLDLCAGTLTLSRDVVARAGASVTAVDFCFEMLLHGMGRLDGGEREKIIITCGDAESLPLKDGLFDSALVTYGIRNLTRVESCLAEINRCLKPGANLVILDFLRPRIPVVASLYRLYLTRILPRIGGLLTGSFSAYKHLSDSIGRFMDGPALLDMLAGAGFEGCGLEVQTLGVAGIFTARKPG